MVVSDGGRPNLRRSLSIGSDAGAQEVDLDGDKLSITPLGGGQEVGRSCLLLKFKRKTILLDCGLHVGHHSGTLPYFDHVDPSEIDVVFISHFHIDHCGALPYFLSKLDGYKGPVYMTQPTKDIYDYIMQDFVRVSTIISSEQLFSMEDLEYSRTRIKTCSYHESVVLDGITVKPYAAGHVLGAAMFMIEIAGVRILYTGDYSREDDRHLRAAEIPKEHPDVLVIESTFGVRNHEPRFEREKRFTSKVREIVKKRRGQCLIPMFVLGRAQELLLILDEYWDKYEDLNKIPIYYASAMAQRCLRVYRRYINYLNDSIREKSDKGMDPFRFTHISPYHHVESLPKGKPCVVLASPGMLQSGPSRILFDDWCDGERNGLIIAGYTVENTLAGQLKMGMHSEIETMSKEKKPMRMTVDEISFAAHADCQATMDFIDRLRPQNIILVHGQEAECRSLMRKIVHTYEERDHKLFVHMPGNLEEVRIRFAGEQLGKVIGKLAKEEHNDGDTVSGILVHRGLSQYLVLHPDDLKQHTGLTTTVVNQKQSVRFGSPLALLQTSLLVVYRSVEWYEEDGFERLKVMDQVVLTKTTDTMLSIEWASNMMNDMVADSVLAVVLQTESNPRNVSTFNTPCGCGHRTKRLKREVVEEMQPESLDGNYFAYGREEGMRGAPEDHSEMEADTKAFARILQSILHRQFGHASCSSEGELIIEVKVDDAVALVDVQLMQVTCETDAELKAKLENAVRRIWHAVRAL